MLIATRLGPLLGNCRGSLRYPQIAVSSQLLPCFPYPTWVWVATAICITLMVIGRPLSLRICTRFGDWVQLLSLNGPVLECPQGVYSLYLEGAVEMKACEDGINLREEVLSL